MYHHPRPPWRPVLRWARAIPSDEARSRDLHMWARRGRKVRSAFLIAGDVLTLAEPVVASRSARDGLEDANRHVSIIGHSGRNRPVLGCGCLAARAARGRTDSKGPGLDSSSAQSPSPDGGAPPGTLQLSSPTCRWKVRALRVSRPRCLGREASLPAGYQFANRAERGSRSHLSARND